MESRGFGRPGRTHLPRPPWTRVDRAALVLAPVLIAIGALWL
jgi:energy-coupling factor transporter transmembrane protein EcfT